MRPGRPRPAVRGTFAMTTFDKREEAFEKKFVVDEELKFKALARRDRLTGLWVAAKLGMSGEQAIAYSREVVAAEFNEGGDAAVIAKLMDDLATKGIAITEDEIRAQMGEFLLQAIAQVKAGT
jgi:hypothetical protein